MTILFLCFHFFTVELKSHFYGYHGVFLVNTVLQDDLDSKRMSFIRKLSKLPILRDGPDQNYMKDLSANIDIFWALTQEDFDELSNELRFTRTSYLICLYHFTDFLLEDESHRKNALKSFDNISHDYIKIHCSIHFLGKGIETKKMKSYLSAALNFKQMTYYIRYATGPRFDSIKDQLSATNEVFPKALFLDPPDFHPFCRINTDRNAVVIRRKRLIDCLNK